MNSEMLNITKAREKLDARYNMSRHNILLVVIFSLVNVILLTVNSGTYFLFTAFFPYYAVLMGKVLGGIYSVEISGAELGFEGYAKTIMIVSVIIALVIIGLYFISWLLSKKHGVGWMIFALVFFSLDTLFLFLVYGIAIDGLLDIVFHGWVIVSLSMGINAYFKLKKMPAERPIFETGPQNPVDSLPNAQGEEEKRTYLRMADFSVKSRTLLETDYAEYKIIYRRVKRINELVVNGMVYGEYDSLIECAHNLSTVLNGNLIEAGYTGVYSYIKFNGTTIAKKLRL